MDRINLGYIKAKVNGQEFHFRSSHIAEILRVLNEGDHSSFDNMRATIFLGIYIAEDELVSTMLDQRTSFSNPMNIKELTKMAFVFLQILNSNILPQFGHLKKLYTYSVYTF